MPLLPAAQVGGVGGFKLTRTAADSLQVKGEGIGLGPREARSVRNRVRH